MFAWMYNDWFSGRVGYGRHPYPPVRQKPDGDPLRSAALLGADGHVLAAVARALLDHPTVTGHVDLAVQNAVVILDGEVDSADAEAEAVAVAWAVPGVSDVCNALTVRGTSSRRH